MRAEQRLAATEPGVPGLPLLLDDDELAAWSRRVLGPGAVGRVRRPYLRWKPGAGGVARVDLGDGAGALSLTVVHADAAAKLDKTVDQVGDDVVAVDPDRLAVLARPGADRDLPGLVRLHRRGHRSLLRRMDVPDAPARRRLRAVPGDADPVTLAWKPQRRWVGRLGDAGDGVVLRAYRPEVAARARDGYVGTAAVLGGAAPRLLGHDLERGLLAVEHLPGRTLDRGPAPLPPQEAAELGRLLARLHRGSVPGPAHRYQVDDEVLAVRAAADLLDLLLPGAGAGQVADRIVTGLLALPVEPLVPVHGDLSVDQVLRRPDGRLALLDLDEAGLGPAALDLGAAAAAWWSSGAPAAGRLAGALQVGYAETATTLPSSGSLRLRTAAQLLRRAAEPFRTGRADWVRAVQDAVAAARAAVDQQDAGPTRVAS